MTRAGRTPPFRDRRGHVVPGSIAEAAYLRLGGTEQWVLMRGENVGNPPLIMLHGGPGFSETALFRHYNSPLERSFTMVNWDQRGCGKSAIGELVPSAMTVEQFLVDLDDLVDSARSRLGKQRVVIFGHSWGSVLGVLYAARFPEKVSAYVGSGQMGDSPAAESASYAWAVAEAERVDDRATLQKLRDIGPPPYDAKSVFAERMCAVKLDGRLKPTALWDIARAVLSPPESSIFELPRAIRSFRATMDAMYPEVSRIDLRERVPALRVPVFLFLGRKDRWVPPETSVEYFDMLSAPSKKLVWFEESGHEPFADEADKFNAAMVDLVRPVALGARPAERTSISL